MGGVPVFTVRSLSRQVLDARVYEEQSKNRTKSQARHRRVKTFATAKKKFH